MFKDRNSTTSLGCLFQCLTTWCEFFFPYIQSEFPFLHLLPVVFLLFASAKSLAYVQLVYQLSAMLLLSHSVPSQYCCTECALSEVHDFVFSFTEFREVPITLFLQPVKILLDGSTPFCLLTAPSGLVSSVNLMWVYSDSSSRLFMKMLNSISPSINP